MQTIQVEGSVFEIEEGQKVIYVAGGCFWGTEHAFKGLRGVCGLCAGYANGNTDHPTYRAVCAGETTGSASSQILPMGSLKAPSPYTMTSTWRPVARRISS